MSSPNTEELLDPEVCAAAAGVPDSTAEPGEPRSHFRDKLMRWVTKGGLAILDQGLISGSNFLIGILLARWLMPEAYGAFALAFSVFLLLSYVYQSFLAEPQAVFSGSAYSGSLRGYLKTLLGIHLILTFFGVVLLGGAAAIALAIGKGNGLPGALAGVA